MHAPPHLCKRAASANSRPHRSAVAPAKAGVKAGIKVQAGIKVVGVGSCGVDYLASIAAFPEPDQKLRTDRLEVQGGGNCANALTAAARLGLAPTIVSKIGGDGLGDGIVSELQADGVDTSLLQRAAGSPSPFTYIIVDRAGGTRTCIHTPGAPMEPEEMTPLLVAAALSDAALVYFDGRLAEAALVLARAARASGVPVLVEGERPRPGLDLLLAEADYVVTSAHFPQAWTGEALLGDALLSMLRRLPRCKLLVTTRGTKGAVLLEPSGAAASGADLPPAQPLEHLVASLTSSLAAHADADADSSSSSSSDGGEPACTSADGQHVLQLPRTAASARPVPLTYTPGRDAAGTAEQVRAAAAAEASANADAANAERYLQQGGGPAAAAASGPLAASVLVVAAATLAPQAVADTTGAGDAFIGTVIYGLVVGLGRQQMAQLASLVAACKCTALGARPGLPRRQQLRPDLLMPPAAGAAAPAAPAAVATR